MRKISLAIATASMLLALSATAVFAGSGNPHLVGSLSVSTSGNSFTITGKIAGLGSGWNGATATGTARVVADITCTSPGGNVAPGQQGKVFTTPIEGSVSGPNANGQYTFTASGSVDTSSAKALGCPNNNWTATADITSVTLLSLHLSGAPGEVDIVV